MQGRWSKVCNSLPLVRRVDLPLEFYSQLRWKEWDISFIFQSHSLHHVGGGCWLAPWVSTGLDSPLREMQTFSLCLPLTAQCSFWEMPGAGALLLSLGGGAAEQRWLSLHQSSEPSGESGHAKLECQAFPRGPVSHSSPGALPSLLQWDWLLVSPFSYVALKVWMNRKLVQIFGGSRTFMGRRVISSWRIIEPQVLRNSLQK